MDERTYMFLDCRLYGKYAFDCEENVKIKTWIYETGKDWILVGMCGRFGRKLAFGSNRQISTLNVVLLAHSVAQQI